MPDGFALLSPLILLPIVLLFVFAGCGLATEGTARFPVVRYQPFDAQNLIAIKTVHFGGSWQIEGTDTAAPPTPIDEDFPDKLHTVIHQKGDTFELLTVLPGEGETITLELFCKVTTMKGVDEESDTITQVYPAGKPMTFVLARGPKGLDLNQD